MNNEDINVYKVLAPKGWSSKKVNFLLKIDPYQTIVSSYTIPLKHPRTGKVLPMKDFALDIIGDSRFAIETDDALIFISRIQNSVIGTIFISVATLPKDALRKKEKENSPLIIY